MDGVVHKTFCIFVAEISIPSFFAAIPLALYLALPHSLFVIQYLVPSGQSSGVKM
jgi:hypothetical protein